MAIQVRWDRVKRSGSNHYKTGQVEPIDLLRSGGMLKDFALGSIIKYAFRCRLNLRIEDLEKIKHYADILIASIEK